MNRQAGDIVGNYHDLFNRITNRCGICLLLVSLIASLCLGSCGTIPAGEDGKSRSYQAGSMPGEVIKIGKSPADGFFWDYYLYIPKETFSEKTPAYAQHLLVAPNNTGTASDDISLHEKRAAALLQRLYRWLARDLGTPCLVPVIPRPMTIKEAPRRGWHYYTHALDRQSLELEVDQYRRVDLQLLAMINHARSILANRGFQIDEKVFMFGFSASGNYTNRFVFLHPQKVRAAAAGGLNGMPLLPLKEMKGRKLYYPVGIYDVQQLTGSPVDLAAVRNTPQFLFMGGQDANDTLPYDDAFDNREREIIKDIFDTRAIREPSEEKAHILIDRFRKSEAVYKTRSVPAQFAVYNGVGHTFNRHVLRDIISFFQQNAEE